MSKHYSIRVFDGAIICEYANVYFSDAGGVATKPLNVTQTDDDGYATLTGDGEYITASYATRKHTIPVSNDDFIYIDVSEGKPPMLGEITVTAKKLKPKTDYTPFVVLGLVFLLVTCATIYAVKKLR